MRHLFVHQNFPGQYKNLAPALSARGDQVVALGITPRSSLPGVQTLAYKLERGNSKDIHPWVSDVETKVIRGEACFKAALALKAKGFEPDVIHVHPGWGEGLFLREAFPKAKILAFFEYYYHPDGADVGFDAEFPRDNPAAGACKVVMKNAAHNLSLDAADWTVCPTHWQASSAPSWVRDKMSVIFDGVDTAELRPDPSAWLKINDSLRLTADDEVVTFINRNLEPYRGYHIFMRALPAILKARPKARILIVGGNEVSYGAAPKQGGSWRQIFLDEVKGQLDMSRVHFTGRVPYNVLNQILRISTAHVYLTYPFVLSWSMMEAMSLGALVIGSDTQPVREVIKNEANGLLVDFFSPNELAEKVIEALANRARFAPLRKAARDTIIQRYDLNSTCLPAQISLVDALASGVLGSQGHPSSPNFY